MELNSVSPKMPQMSVAKGNNVSVIIDTDVNVITLICHYLYVLWERDCIRGVKRTCYRAAAGEQTACSYSCLNTSLEMQK